MTTNALLFVAVVGLCTFATSAGKVQDKVADKYMPVALDQTHLESFLGERMDANLNKRLLNVDEKGILEGFQHRPGKQAWIGEHAGKFLHAAANAYLYSHDAKLKEKMDRVARELMKCQMEDGYLGTYVESQRWTAWDVWVHKYDLLGLLRYHDVTGDEQSLDVCRRIGDLLIRTLGDGQNGSVNGKDISKAGEHIGMAATSVLEPMVYLYRETGEQKYLDFCFYITRSIEANSKVISNLTETKKVYGTANNKAYEMLSNLVGLTELYRVTGDDKYLTPALFAFDDIVKNRLYITGTGSAHEHWQEDDYLPAGEGDDIGEGCVTVTWEQLNLSLLRLTAASKYADQLERSIYNHLIGAQNEGNGDVCYYMPLIGTKHPTPGINCCVSSVPRGIELIPTAVWGRRGDGIAVNIYNSGMAKIALADGKEIEVTCKSGLPRNGHVTLSMKSPTKVQLYLRIPQWTDLPEKFKDAKVDGGYRTIDWDGSPLELVMEPKIQYVDGGKTYPHYVGVERGPQVLCFDADKNPDVPLPALASFAQAKPEIKDGGDGTYRAAGTIDVIDQGTKQFKKEQRELVLTTFADATSPRVWLPPADSLPSGAAPITFNAKESQSRPSRNTDEGPFTDLRPDTYRSTRNGSLADEDWFAVELNSPAKISRVVYRHGTTRFDGGWFDTSSSKPRIEYKATADGEWKPLGTLDDYPATTAVKCEPVIPSGQPFELKLKEPVTAAAIRIVGKPSLGFRKNRNFSTCAELQAYE